MNLADRTRASCAENAALLPLPSIEPDQKHILTRHDATVNDPIRESLPSNCCY